MNDQDLHDRLTHAGEAFLRRAAESPDLDAMLGAARRKQRRYRVSMATAATAVGVVATVMAVQMTGHSGNDRHSAGPSEPHPATPSATKATPSVTSQTPPPTIRQDGKTLTYVGEELWSQPTIDESHPNSVIVFASVGGGTAPWGQYCTAGTTATARVVTETAEAVTIAVSKYAIRQGSSTVCIAIGRGPIPVTVALSKPLGSRQLVDAKDHVARKVLDPATVLKPTNLPAGYTGGQATWADRAETRAQRYYHSSGGDLIITVGPASLNKPLRNILKHTTIRGHSATVSFDKGFDYDLQIAWNEDRTHAVTFYQVSNYKNSRGLGLNADQLIAIANSLR